MNPTNRLELRQLPTFRRQHFLSGSKIFHSGRGPRNSLPSILIILVAYPRKETTHVDDGPLRSPKQTFLGSAQCGWFAQGWKVRNWRQVNSILRIRAERSRFDRPTP